MAGVNQQKEGVSRHSLEHGSSRGSLHVKVSMMMRQIRACLQAVQGRAMGNLGLGGQMGQMGAALGLGTSPGRSNAMNNLHAGNMSTAFNQPSNNLLAMFNKGGMNGMGTQGFGGHTAGELFSPLSALRTILEPCRSHQ